MSARRIGRVRQTKLSSVLTWFRTLSIGQMVGVVGGIFGIAFSIVYIGVVLGWWGGGDGPLRIEPNIPSEISRGELTNITGNNLDLVSRVRLSNGAVEEPLLLMPGNETRLTILVPDGVIPGPYTIEFIRQGKDDPVASGNTEVKSGPGGDDEPPIKFADLGWKSAQIQNAIARKIIEEGYGRETTSVFGPISRLWDSLFDGSIDVMMEVWLPNYQKWWEQGLEEGSVIPLGKSLDENWQSSFVIPTYLAEQYPGLISVSDLPEFAHLFAGSDGKALLNTCLVAWVCSEINVEQVKAYGLQDVIKFVYPASENILFGSLRTAYSREQPWLGYLWGPTKIALDLDITRLEEPPYSDSCWDAHKGCAYPTSKVRIVVHPSMIAEAPGIMEFLRRWDLDTDTQIAIEDHFETTNEDYEATAVWFLRNLPIIWNRWVPSDVFERVKSAVADR